MDTEYIDRKIENCQGLVDTATSEDQKEIYQGYLEFWQKKIPKSNKKPDTETGGGSRTPLTKSEPEPEVDKTGMSIQEDGLLHQDPIDDELPHQEEEKEAEEKAILEKELQDTKDKLAELQKAEEFKLAYPDKKAYYNRDDKTHKTNAFKEFLISKE